MSYCVLNLEGEISLATPTIFKTEQEVLNRSIEFDDEHYPARLVPVEDSVKRNVIGYTAICVEANGAPVVMNEQVELTPDVNQAKKLADQSLSGGAVAVVPVEPRFDVGFIREIEGKEYRDQHTLTISLDDFREQTTTDLLELTIAKLAETYPDHKETINVLPKSQPSAVHC